MISFSNILQRVLTERMSFKDLYDRSDPARIARSNDVSVRPLRVETMDGDEAWTFSYKSSPSTTGQRWAGYVRFFKEDVSSKESAGELDCIVDCECPDYRYRWAYANTKQDASVVGGNSWSGCINSPPNRTNPDQVPGMCKHLISLGEFLKTKLEPDAPEPEDTPERPTYHPTKIQPKVKVTPTTPQTSDAPDPEDSYSDSREGGTYSDSRGGLQEQGNRLFERMTSFVRSTPVFDVPLRELRESVLLQEGYQRGEWWIDETGNTIFADGDVGDQNHEAVVIQNLVHEILSSFGIHEDEPGELASYEDTIRDGLIGDGQLSEEELKVWNNENVRGGGGGPSEIIIKKLLEDGTYKDQKQAEDAVYIAYGSSSRDARNYAMRYWRWKIMKNVGGSLEVQTWELKPEDLGIIVRGAWEIMDDYEDDEPEPEDVGEIPGPKVNVTVQSSGKRFSEIPLAAMEKKMPAALHHYQSGVHVGYTETITEDFHHLHKEYRLYEGHRKIVAVFEDNTRLSFEVHFHDKHKEDRDKHRRKAFTKWKSVANEIHGDVPLTNAGNPIQKTWKESFRLALKDPRMEEFIRTKQHRAAFPR